jgi:transcription elongation factor Elf1
MDHQFHCTHCNHLNKISIPITSNFFWPW